MKTRSKVRLIRPTWESNWSGIKLEVGHAYTIERIDGGRFVLVEGYHNEYGGWWYEKVDFVPMPQTLNDNIRVI